MNNKPNNKEDKEKSVPYCSNAPCLHDRPQKHCVACCPLPNNKVEKELLKEVQATIVCGCSLGKCKKCVRVLVIAKAQYVTGYEQGVRDTKRRLMDWVEHDKSCILARFEAGEPTESGGYRQKFAGKWYEAKPVDKTPKCDCGLHDALKNN